ncbi:uncharacterized protein NECHADRAFT_75990 [Fusarium vanettenii 77-13-4]|uniref:C2H2-type domain-containing protein n=1 Tax=Fusarium vanettenii (strain ATCC MYA-4622 / CBS 123669 / FGSC 9596 / NRRL 45880 / 77-13-4) TaxID=660122 RepID=C7Z661_FUSV7|nr:uncharacterized protein NECHADRAFT_75990 [Fusarium vanettenii 77-13-4]EEU40641.1 hypothetical protein NECHADRAFT_75990 [Fusarium vanettenii 77-13-4]
MPWTIWPALVVLWGVCWMFYPSPDKTFDGTSLDSQPPLEYQLRPEELDDGLLWLDLSGVHPISQSFGDLSFSAEWWNHDAEPCPPTSTRQPGPTTTFDPDRSTTNPSNAGSASQHELVSGPQRQSESQWGGPEMDDVTNHIVAMASEPTATNRLKCPDCDKILSRHDSLRRHQQTQHNREVEEHLCPYKPCKRSRQGSGFSRPDGLRRHLKACKLRRKRALTVASEAANSQTDSGNGTREDSQARSSSHDTRGTENCNDANTQQSSSDSLIVGLRRRLAEAEEARDKAKREYEEAQKRVASYEMTIEMLEKEHT